MRTSLSEIAKIEKYIFRQYATENDLLFQVKMILDKDLRRKVFLQKKIYRLLTLFHRNELKKQAALVFASMMEKPSFKKEISGIFKQNSDD